MGRLIVVALLALAALGACTGADDDAAPTGAERLDARSSADRDASANAPESGGGGTAALGAGPDPQAGDGEAAGTDAVRPAALLSGRRMIRTAEIELTSDDPDATADDVMRLAERAGGFVATTDLRRDDDDVLRGTIRIRVPSDDLLSVLADLEELAVSAPVSRVDERDVTTEATDLEARLTNLTAYEDELRALLADVREDTSSPDDLLRIFERIREVRSEIDTIEARLATLEEQVALATVDVSIEPAPAALPVTDPAWEPLETTREALTAAARGLSRLADAGIWLVVGVLPVVLVVAVPAAVLLAAWRRLRHRPGTTPADAT